MNKKKISFSELTRYSKLHNILKNQKNNLIKYKTKSEVLREFDKDKWGTLLKFVEENSNCSILDINNKMFSSKNLIPTFFEKEFYLMTPKLINKLHLDLYKKIISKHLDKASCLVELGAGYGSKLLNLSLLEEFKKIPMVAGELSYSGQKVTKKLSDNMAKHIEVGYCDIDNLDNNEIKIPKNSIIFTSYASHYIPLLKNRFINQLIKFEPKVIINFEPSYELNSPNSEFGLMCRKYIEINDYNTNLYSLLKKEEKLKKINLEIKEKVIGTNPFLPISIFEWSKKQ